MERHKNKSKFIGLFSAFLLTASSFTSFANEQFIIYGHYKMDTLTGNVYYLDENNEILKDTIAPDGCYYDSNGVQQNTLLYVGNKYYDKIFDDSEGIYIEFDDEQELLAFVNYLQIYQANRQGVAFNPDPNHHNWLLRTQAQYTVQQKSQKLLSTAKELAAQVDTTQDFTEVIRTIKQLTLGRISYDYTLESTNYPLDLALDNSTGVCYHQAKLAYEICVAAGIPAEIVAGNRTQSPSGGHVWIKAQDTSTGRWHYFDPSEMLPVTFPTDTYYLSLYQQERITSQDAGTCIFSSSATSQEVAQRFQAAHDKNTDGAQEAN